MLSIDSSEDALEWPVRTSPSTSCGGEMRMDHRGRLPGAAHPAGQMASIDLVILDPPKFAPTASQAQKAARGYKVLQPAGVQTAAPRRHADDLLCSGGIDAAFFLKIVADAALDAGGGRTDCAEVVPGCGPSDLIGVSGRTYLKGLVCRVGD